MKNTPPRRKDRNRANVRPPSFLPMSREEMDDLEWAELDFLCVVGDAYIDHPSFGIAIVSRVLESCGFKVGIVAQPDWRGVDNFTTMGRPRLGVLVSAGNLDSMLSNYSSPQKRRARDSYSPGGAPRKRPDRATIVYCNRIREIWGDIPVIIGGIEASLRRMAHYDYWADEVRRSMLADSRADLLIYGMAEFQLKLAARRLSEGEPVSGIRDIPGTCWKARSMDDAKSAAGFLEIPSFEAVRSDKKTFSEAFRIFYEEQNFASGRAIAQDQGAWAVVQNPPAPPLSQLELDKIYSLPYARRPHLSYGDQAIPAFEEVKFSISSHRGCFGGCAFCAITLHQGQVIQARSKTSIVREAEILTKDPDFKGYIHDIGGPTANFRVPSCPKSLKSGPCKGKQCLFPAPCSELSVSHDEYLDILRSVAATQGIKKVFVRSGLRIDYILADPAGRDFLEELCRNHVSGQMKIAPEHADRSVLNCMRKSPPEVTRKFV
ncbi:MAG: YgiQ family radical SAM protein, partial [Synergistaceae bacterium]|nr:YgiQ family radical SAM protein [Synergistaceae bacterium]